MSEKPKGKPKAAKIEFVAPHPLADCIYRILDTQTPAEGITRPGYKPSVEKIESTLYRFQIAMQYGQEKRRTSPLILLEGHLNQLDEESTSVSGEVHIGATGLILGIGLSVLLLGGLTPFMPAPVAMIVFVGLIAFWVWFLVKVYSDSRLVVHLLYQTLTGETPA